MSNSPIRDEARSSSTISKEGELAAAGGDIESAREGGDDAKLELEEKDPFLVDWEGDDDPGNPLNFKARQKFILMAMIAGIAFLTYLSLSRFTSSQLINSVQLLLQCFPQQFQMSWKNSM